MKTRIRLTARIRKRVAATCLSSAALVTLTFGQALYSEDFDSVSLGPNVDETVAGEAVWTAEPPAGWSVDNSSMPMSGDALIGTTEWRGWTFADPTWWASVDDQMRSNFTKASGAAAIADPDEWDDVGSPAGVGNFDSTLISPPISIAGQTAGSLKLQFDSAWRPEGTQTATVEASFDGGERVRIVRFSSVAGDPDFKNDQSTNDTITASLQNPDGAEEVVLYFRMFDAGNNWFWAIDNVEILTELAPVVPSDLAGTVDRGAQTVTLEWQPGANIDGAMIELLRDDEVIAELPLEASSYVDSPPGVNEPGRIEFTYSLRLTGGDVPFEPLSLLVVYHTGVPSRTLFEENFDSVTLGQNVDEGNFGEMVWTAEPPAGWTVDNSKMPRVDGELVGMTEWRGWTFADPVWWASVDDQQRSAFTKASGAIAVADPDEWDDADSAASVGNFESYLISPPIDVTAEAGSSVTLAFDSAWRPEGNQKGNIVASFDSGEPVEVLLLTTETTGDETNESKFLQIPVPAGATEMTLTFGMFDAGNNWFWAIDNILVTTELLPICPTAISQVTDAVAKTVTLSWQPAANLGAGAAIEIYRDGELADTLPASASSYNDAPEGYDPDTGLIVDYEVRAVTELETCEPLTVRIVFPPEVINKIAQWDFEEGSGSVANNRLGEDFQGELVDLSDDAWVDGGFLGLALDFAATGYVDLGTSAEDDATRALSDGLRPLAGITLAAWVKPSAFDEWAGIGGAVFDSGSTESGFYLNTREPGDFSFALATEGTGLLNYLRAPGELDVWQYVVGTYDGQTQRLYINGVEAASAPASGLIDYDPEPYGFQIGTFIDDNEDDRFHGQITQVALWDGALTADEVYEQYLIGLAGASLDPAEDMDGDGIRDAWEIDNFGDIETFSGIDDPDEDGLRNIGEEKAGSDPNSPDSDNDGVEDGTEVAFGSDPLDGASAPPANGVALADANSGIEDWNTASDWSNGEAPSAGMTYFVNGDVARRLRGPVGGDLAFAGDSLKLFGGSELVLAQTGGVARVTDLIVDQANIVQGGAEGSSIAFGDDGDAITMEGNARVYFLAANSSLMLGSDISGSATVTLANAASGSNLEFAGNTVQLNGDNSGFNGVWDAVNVVINPTQSTGLGNAELRLTNARLDADADISTGKGLLLRGDGIQLVLDQRLTFTSVKIGDDFELPEQEYAASDLLALGFTEGNVVDGGGVLVVDSSAQGDVDSDGDGLTDEAETTIHNTDPAKADTDGDGRNDGAEVKAGTSPLDPASRFEVTLVVRENDGGVRLVWTSAAGHSYTVETSADGDNWTAVEPSITADGESAEYTDSAADGAAKFYRVRAN